MRSGIVRCAAPAAIPLFACTTVGIVSEHGGTALPRPDRVLVYDLAVTPEEVQLDHGLSALARHLVERIQEMGLPAERAVGPAPEGTNDLLIRGQFLPIDEGNRTERLVIGLGAGRTDVDAEVRLVQDDRVVEELDSNARSGVGPGMAESMGVGALAGHLVVSAIASVGVRCASETFGSDVEADADRSAKKIAETIEPLFVQQQWIPADWRRPTPPESISAGSVDPAAASCDSATTRSSAERRCRRKIPWARWASTSRRCSPRPERRRVSTTSDPKASARRSRCSASPTTATRSRRRDAGEPIAASCSS